MIDLFTSPIQPYGSSFLTNNSTKPFFKKWLFYILFISLVVLGFDRDQWGVRCFLLRASDFPFPWFQWDVGCTWSQLLYWLLANLHWAFHQSTPLCVTRLPHHMTSGFQEGGKGSSSAQASEGVGRVSSYPISQAVSETRSKERGHGASLMDGRCVKELGGHF